MKSKQLDQWFTIPETVALCMAHIDTKGFTDIIDPCAGDKAFKDHCSSFYDIDPRHPDIIEQDFMELNLPHDKNRLFLTNFPYGKSGKLSIQMINHASTMADTIATIVPNTLLRYSAQRRVNSELKLLLSIPLPEKSFTLDGKPVDVPSQFQVWSRDGSSCIRTEQLPNTHKDFIISSRYNPNATFVIRGVRPKVSNEVDVYSRISSNTRYYSVEPLVDGVEDVFRSIDLVSLCSKSTGMPCMSIPDCIKAYDDAGSCLRVPEPTVAVNEDWFFDNKNPNFIVMTNTREVKRIEDMLPTNNCKKIHSHLSFEELVLRFGSIKWKGVPMMRGGGFSITNAELSTQYKAGMI